MTVKGDDGEPIETPDQIIQRVSEFVGDTDEQKEDFKLLLRSKKFFPNTPTWINANNPRRGTSSACFTFDVQDDLYNIFHVMGTKAARITQEGGGVGFNLSNLRPKGDIVRSSGKIASGVLSWMRVADTMADVVSQGGVRRGAIMCLLDISHPDIYDFIESKSNSEYAYTNMNISVKITDAFMKAVEEGKDWDLINPRDKSVWKSVNARKLLETIAKHSAKYGEPGVVFSDTINEHNPTPHLGRMETTNPCAEYPGYDNESCTLGSINLYEHLTNTKLGFNYDSLEKTVRLAVNFLDNVISKNTYSFPEIEEATLLTRKIGLGVMGWATALLAMRVKYGSPYSIYLAREVMEFINTIARDESRILGELKGSYPAYDGEGYMRNATRTTIAPTGTISIVAQVSGGIEPLFSFVVERPILGGKKIVDFDPAFIRYCEKYDIPEKEVKKAISLGSLRNTSFPEYLKEFMVTAMDITAEEHLETQRAFQTYTDNAVSKTVNLPKGSTWKNILRIYLDAYEFGLKGVAVYIDGSREVQVLNRPTDETVHVSKPVQKIEPVKQIAKIRIAKPIHSGSTMHYDLANLSFTSDLSHCVNGRCNI
jgi:ribonucleoside-diphosphate reductase alpha chain